MNVEELTNFLMHHNIRSQVFLLQCSDDNPISDAVEIKKVIGIEDNEGNEYVVLIPN